MDIPNLNIGVVTGPDDVVKFWDWLQNRPKGYVAIDVETGNTDPDKDARHWYEPGAHVRMVQFGDAKGGWAIPMQGWEGLVRGAFDWLNRARIKQVWHNGFTFDATFLEYCHGIKLDPTLTEDTFVYAGLVGYAEDSRELKRICENKFGPWASAGSDQLHQGMKNAGWNWSTVPMTWMPYPVYGVQDTIIDSLLYESMEEDIARVKPFHDREIASAWMTNRACMTGITVDGKYLERTYRHWRAEADRLKAECKAQGWGEPTKTAQIRAILAEANVLDDTITTEGGLISVDKKQLTQAAAKHPLAQLVLDHRWAERVAENYLRKLWSAIDYGVKPGKVHPSIWTMEARTSRMCLPDSHRILTRRGVLHVDEVVVGDLTLDADGQWVPVQHVHRYADQDVIQWSGAAATLVSTAEHRWVNYTDKLNQPRRLDPIAGKSRRVVVLAPEVEPFDFTRTSFDAKTDSGTLAAIIGFLVSDGRMYRDPRTGLGAKAMIYQTERKYYQQIIDLLPRDCISYDRITADTQSGPHHEIGLRARWLRPRMEAAGIWPEVGVKLKESDRLVPWVLSISDEDVRLFLQAVWLADGSMSSGHRIPCGSENLRQALAIAAYRCGMISRVHEDAPGGWSTGPRKNISFCDGQVHTRYLSETSAGSTDVWCVTTATGTFTAWGPQGPYLTGNSASNPPVQQFPASDPTVRNAIIADSRDHVLIAADYGQIETRGWASLFDDQPMKDMINETDRTGQDYFALLAQRMFHDPTITKSSPIRKNTKNIGYAMQYGAQIKKLGEMTGLPEDEVRPVVDGYRAMFPSYKDGGASMIEDLGGGHARTVLPDGRSFQVRTWGEQRKLPNYRVQGWAAGVLKDALLSCGAAGLGDAFRLPVHDELIFCVHKNDAQDAAVEIKECMDSIVDPEVYGVAVTTSPTIALRWGNLKD